MLGAKAATAEAALRERLKDNSGAVQVAAAEALAHMGQVTPALPALEARLADTGSPWFGLQAANVLDRLGEIARPSLPAMRQALQRADAEAGASNPLQYQRRILERTVSVLEGKAQALVYPPARD